MTKTPPVFLLPPLLFFAFLRVHPLLSPFLPTLSSLFLLFCLHSAWCSSLSRSNCAERRPSRWWVGKDLSCCLLFAFARFFLFSFLYLSFLLFGFSLCYLPSSPLPYPFYYFDHSFAFRPPPPSFPRLLYLHLHPHQHRMRCTWMKQRYTRYIYSRYHPLPHYPPPYYRSSHHLHRHQLKRASHFHLYVVPFFLSLPSYQPPSSHLPPVQLHAQLTYRGGE
mmetsp:Transcript_50004/g.128718  ORF Transcript_50004/g.128718 Transcript_50004/m.128718 type:complete len:221 (+) Transcript_50004:1647-2309(+)